MKQIVDYVNLLGRAVNDLLKEILPTIGRQSNCGLVMQRICDELGLEPLGARGNFAFCVMMPGREDVVLKVLTGENGDPLEDGYLDYIAWVMRNANGNQNLPLVYDCRLFDRCAIVAMERLYKADTDNMHGGSAKFLHKYSYKTAGELYGRDDINPMLLRCIEQLGKFNDLHGGNIMVRRTADGKFKEYVVTDPYYRRAPAGLRCDQFRLANGRFGFVARVFQGPNISDLLTDRDMQAVKRISGKRNIPVPRVGCHDDDGNFHKSWWLANKNKEVKRDRRPTLVMRGAVSAVRREKEDRMLRIRAKHDRQPLGQRVPRPLLPGRKPRRVCTAQRPLVVRDPGKKADCGKHVQSGPVAVADFAGLEHRILARMASERKIMVAEKQRELGLGEIVRDMLRSGWRPPHGPNTRVACAQDFRRKRRIWKFYHGVQQVRRQYSPLIGPLRPFYYVPRCVNPGWHIG